MGQRTEQLLDLDRQPSPIGFLADENAASRLTALGNRRPRRGLMESSVPYFWSSKSQFSLKGLRGDSYH